MSVLHYYVDLLRMKDGEKRTSEQTDYCVTALHNVIRTMRLSRHDKICGEDFSRLDFGNIPFNGIHWSIDRKVPCRFDGCKLNEWNFMSGHTGTVIATAWSPDGNYVLTGSTDRTAILWSAKSGMMLRKLKGHVGSVSFVGFSSSGKYCITCANNYKNNSAKIWNVETGDCLNTVWIPFIIETACMPFEGLEYMIGAVDINTNEFHIVTNSKTYTFEGREQKLTYLIISPNGKLCVSGYKDGLLKVWNVYDEECKNIIDKQYSTIIAASFSLDGKTFITHSENETSYIWKQEKEKLRYSTVLNNYDHVPGQVFATALFPKGKYCIKGTFFNKLFRYYIFDVESKEYIKSIKMEINSIENDPSSIYLVLSNDEKYCTMLYDDATVIIFEVQTGRILHHLVGCRSNYNIFGVSLDEKYLFINSEHKTLKFINTESQKIRLLNPEIKADGEVVFSSDSKYCSIITNRKVYVYETETGKHISTISTYVDKYRKTIFPLISSNGNYYLTHCITNGKDTVAIWKTPNNCLYTIPYFYLLDEYAITSFAVSSDDRFVLFGLEGFVVIYELENNRYLYRLNCNSFDVHSLLFSSDGRYLMTLSYGLLNVFDTFNNIGSYGNTSKKFEKRSSFYFYTFSLDNNFCFTSAHDDCDCLNIRDIDTGDVLIKIHSPELGTWLFPYYISTSMQDNILFGILKYNYSDVINNIKNTFVYKEKPMLIGKFYNIDGLHIKNCSFQNITSDETTSKILYQYGGDIEKPEQ